MDIVKEVVFDCVEKFLPKPKANEVMREFIISYLKGGYAINDSIESIHYISMNAMEILMRQPCSLDDVLNDYFDMNYRAAERILKGGLPGGSRKVRDLALYDFHMNAAVAASLQGKKEKDLGNYEIAYVLAVRGGEISEEVGPKSDAIEAFGLAGDIALEAVALAQNDKCWIQKAEVAYQKVASMQRLSLKKQNLIHPAKKKKNRK